jgi:hypothetical protein
VTAMSSENLWTKYCGFFDQNYSKQLEYNRKQMEEHLERWRGTELAKILCPKGVDKVEDIPLTTHSDYPLLKDFGERIEEKAKTVPRLPSELLVDYYDRIGREAAKILEGYMPYDYSFAVKTTGFTGENKWIVHCDSFWQHYLLDVTATMVMACSDEWGSTKIKDGAKGLNIGAPAPYLSGWATKASEAHFVSIPPPQVTDNLTDMKRKFYLALKYVEEGHKIELGGGIGSMFYMMCKYFTDPEFFYSEYRKAINFNLAKVFLYFKWIQSKLLPKRYKDIRDLMPLKGVAIAGVDARLYLDFFRKDFGVEPLNVYGASEVGIAMLGTPNGKLDLTPNLRNGYLEFITEEGEVKGLDDLRVGNTYELVCTPFGSLLARYRLGDLLKVIHIRDDGMPVFSFEGRTTTVIDMQGYFRLTENIFSQALVSAGLTSSDKWAVTKIPGAKEHLHILMEREWPYSEEEAAKIIFTSLQAVSEDFKKYVRDFGIKDPSQTVKVEYLRPGAFLRYSIIQAKKGMPIGQYKPPKVIPPEKAEIFETLRKA